MLHNKVRELLVRGYEAIHDKGERFNEKELEQRTQLKALQEQDSFGAQFAVCFS